MPLNGRNLILKYSLGVFLEILSKSTINLRIALSRPKLEAGTCRIQTWSIDLSVKIFGEV
jgi:hypothetical protein